MSKAWAQSGAREGGPPCPPRPPTAVRVGEGDGVVERPVAVAAHGDTVPSEVNALGAGRGGGVGFVTGAGFLGSLWGNLGLCTGLAIGAATTRRQHMQSMAGTSARGQSMGRHVHAMPGSAHAFAFAPCLPVFSQRCSWPAHLQVQPQACWSVVKYHCAGAAAARAVAAQVQGQPHHPQTCVS